MLPSPRLCAAALLLAVALPAVASGHGTGRPTAADRQHAKRDLAGVSVQALERASDPRAGLRSRGGQARRLATGPREAVGSWGPVEAMPVVPVFLATLPSGKLLMWDSVGDNPAESYRDHTFTRAAVYDPATKTSKRVDVASYNIFCAGYAHLPNGNVLVVGGNADSALSGIRQTHIFDWRTETWSRGPSMRSARWYPSVAAQADGSALIIGGGPTVGERYNAGAINELPGVVTRSSRNYPFMQLTANGRTLFSDTAITGDEVTIAGGGAVQATGSGARVFGDYGSYAQFDIGKTLFSGGGGAASAGASIVETGTGAPVLRNVAAMTKRRRQHTLSVLADGSVLASGGLSTSGLVDLRNAVYEAERFDPATSTWRELAPAAVARQYHSVATLLPDGRVFTGGGGICGECSQQNYLRKDAEIYTPPYLYRRDGSGELAPRPEITTAPRSLLFGLPFMIGSPQAQAISKVGLVRLGAPTHGQDQDQRYVPLNFRSIGRDLIVDAPRNAFEAPPGYYMLFIVDAGGVPSVASMLRIDRSAPPEEMGQPVPAVPPTPLGGTGDAPAADTNLALGRPASGSAACSSSQGPDKAVNGSYQGGSTDRWCSKAATKWWQVDLGAARQLTSIVIRHAQAGGEAASLNTRDFSVLTSTDGSSWSVLATVTGNTAATTTHSAAGRLARYVRIDVKTGTSNRRQWWQSSVDLSARLYEVEVLGGSTGVDPEAPSLGRSYAAIEGAAALYAARRLTGTAQRLEAGEHDVARGNLGPARGGVQSLEIAQGYRATICPTTGSCLTLAAGRYPQLPSAVAGAVRSVSVERIW